MSTNIHELNLFKKWARIVLSGSGTYIGTTYVGAAMAYSF
jgi:hypothetical protein